MPTDVPSAITIDASDSSVLLSGTTSFIDNSTVNNTKGRSLLTDPLVGVQTFDDNSIKDFLAKPRVVGSGSFATSHSGGDVLWNNSVFTDLTSQTLWTQKISGYGLFRGTACYKVVFNANPFQAGRVIFHFLPCYRHLVAANPHYTAAHIASLEQCTMTPNVELDIKDSSLEMEIPYITPSSYLDMTTSVFDWGHSWLRVLSPLKTGASGLDHCDFVVYLSFKDVEFSAPMFAPESELSTEASPGSSKRKLRKEQSRIAQRGTFEDTLDKVGDAGTLLSDIPVIGEVAAAAGGVAKIGSAIAGLFGWNKPLDVKEGSSAIIHPYRNMQNIDGKSLSDSMSLGVTPIIEPNTGVVGSSVDEMSYSFLKSVPMLWKTFTIASTDNLGHKYIETAMPLHEMIVNKTWVVGGNTYIGAIRPPFVHLAYLHTGFRGSVKLTLKFVKTNFHSGRILVTWSPNASASTGVSLVNNSAYVLREIIDLKTTTEVTLTLPYLKSTAYINSYIPYSGAPPELFSLGNLTIALANPIAWPETVASSMDCLAYLSGGDDMEFVNYCGTEALPFVPEGGGEESKMIGSAKEPNLTLGYNISSSGDVLLSIKSLMLSAKQIYTNVDTKAAENVSIYPFTYGMYRPNTKSLAMPPVGGDTVSYFALGYAMSRGGMRFLGRQETNTHNATQTLQQDKNPAAVLEVGSGDVWYSSFKDYANASILRPNFQQLDVLRNGITGQYDGTCPHYGLTPMRLNHINTSDRVGVSGQIDVYRYKYTRHLQTGTGSDYENPAIFRAAADDFSLHYFIGFPPVVYSWTNGP